jgi:exodeoxyribonuclease VII large subunit|tara:strand:+ start:197 stop:1405 length:1209 start_codon:yes stop_codon:yes gene_type:complete
MSEFQDCYTVSNLNRKIRDLLEYQLIDIWVKGEISNFHHHPSSGHMYFTLKDGGSELRCTMFRMNNSYLKFKPSDGMEVRLFGLVTVYEKRGQVQFKVTNMEPLGLGDLYRAYELLKRSLDEEGLFDDRHKMKIPPYPNKIGIITSGSGSAYQDILNVLSRRNPNIDVLLKSVKVQGNGSAEEIVDAIEIFNNYDDVDLLVIARGGGSIEDLWSFNEEKVARAIFDSSIPIISGIGHETDYTITDFVSDLRAPTPSAAAELAVPQLDDLLSYLAETKNRLIRSVIQLLEQKWQIKDQLQKRASYQQPIKKIERQFEKLNILHDRSVKLINVKYEKWFQHTEYLSKQLLSLGPKQVLERGYAIPFNQSGEIIRRADQISIGEGFELKTAKGSLGAKKTSDISK